MAPSLWQIVIVLIIVLLLFGTKRLRNIGSDLGAAIKGFRSGMGDGTDDTPAEPGKLGSSDASRSAAEREKQQPRLGRARAIELSGGGMRFGAGHKLVRP